MSLVESILDLVEVCVNSVLGAVMQFLMGLGIDVDLPVVEL